MDRWRVRSMSSEHIDSNRVANGAHWSICPRDAISSRFEAAEPATAEKAANVLDNA